MPTPDPQKYGRAEVVPVQMLPEVVFDCQNPADSAPHSLPLGGRPKGRKVRRKHLLAFVVVLAGGVGLYWLLTDRLTEEERQLVGRWSRTVTDKSPDDTLVVMELSDDRTCRFAAFDAATGRPLQNALEGRWSVRSGELALDYETRTLHRVAREVPGLRSHVRPLRAESLTVESVEPGALRLRTRGRPPLDPPETQVYTRAADDIVVMPASFAPSDLAR